MNEREVNRIFGRINSGCLGCTHWKGDRVRAAVGRFLVETWDRAEGQPPPIPPTPEQLGRLCCKYEPKPGETDPNFVATFAKTDW